MKRLLNSLKEKEKEKSTVTRIWLGFVNCLFAESTVLKEGILFYLFFGMKPAKMNKKI
jgi:hypothetical protein